MTQNLDKERHEETGTAKSRHSAKKQQGGAAPETSSETAQYLHELLLHQVAQEAQNEAQSHSLWSETETRLARYTDLYDFAPVGYFTLARDGAIIQTNLTGASQLGQERTRLPGARFGLFIAETGLAVFNACLDQVFTTSVEQTCELTLIRSGQSPLMIQLTALSVPNGQECRVVTVDITARTQTEELLHERLKEITCLYSLRRVMGLELSIDEICQRISTHLTMAMRFPEITVVVIELDGRQFASPGYCKELTHKLHAPIAANGRTCGQLQVFYRGNKSFLLPEEQNLIDAIALDLQWWFERKQVAETLAASLEKSRMIQSALDAHSIVAITDKSGKITYANDKFCAISKYSRAELIGQNHHIINSGFHSKEFIRQLWTTIAQGRVWKGEIKNRAKDGSFYWVDTTIVPFLDPAGKPYQYVAIRTEITERKQLDQLMEQQIEELARSNVELGQFAYVATHDLQEPLRAITSCVQLLRKRYQGQLDVRADEFITHAVDGTKRMQTLINDLLAYSQVNANHASAPVDCNVLLDNVLADLAASIADTGATVTHEPLPTVNGIPSQLAQIFQNLVSNAIKFRGEHPPEIHIGATRKTGEWLFSVADNGIGMEAQYAERIFRIFQRLHTRKEYPGTGIGLAICKKVAEHHGGRIWVESQPNQGATFYFTIAEKE